MALPRYAQIDIGLHRSQAEFYNLVCHGSLPRNKEPYLFLQDQAGQTAPILARELADRIQELQNLPRLIVLASRESATKDDGALAQFALAPRLADDLRDQICGIYHKRLLAKARVLPHAAELRPPELIELVVDELRKDPTASSVTRSRT